jgi:hypothetical protein
MRSIHREQFGNSTFINGNRFLSSRKNDSVLNSLEEASDNNGRSLRDLFLMEACRLVLDSRNSSTGLVEDRMVEPHPILRLYPGPIGSTYRLPIPSAAQQVMDLHVIFFTKEKPYWCLQTLLIWRLQVSLEVIEWMGYMSVGHRDKSQPHTSLTTLHETSHQGYNFLKCSTWWIMTD